MGYEFRCDELNLLTADVNSSVTQWLEQLGGHRGGIEDPGGIRRHEGPVGGRDEELREGGAP